MLKSSQIDPQVDCMRADIKHKTKGFIQSREPDKKMAYLVLADGQKFTFPNIFEKKPPPSKQQMKEFQKVQREGQLEQQQTWERGAVPPWFRF
nr:CARP-L23 [Biomphalaria glabrata]